MKKVNLTSIIRSVQNKLLKNPIDLVHDINHHYRVFQEGLIIVESEKLKIDKQLLTIVTWIHDLFDRKGKNIKAIEKFLLTEIKSTEYRFRIISIIQEHSYNKKQTTLESKVLYDADKLEYVNPYRLLWLNQIHTDRYISSNKYYRYKEEWHKKVINIIPNLHFEYTKDKYKKLLPIAYEIINKNMNFTSKL